MFNERIKTERIHYNSEFGKIRLTESDKVVDDSWLCDYHRYHGFALRFLGEITGETL